MARSQRYNGALIKVERNNVHLSGALITKVNPIEEALTLRVRARHPGSANAR